MDFLNPVNPGLPRRSLPVLHSFSGGGGGGRVNPVRIPRFPLRQKCCRNCAIFHYSGADCTDKKTSLHIRAIREIRGAISWIADRCAALSCSKTVRREPRSRCHAHAGLLVIVRRCPGPSLAARLSIGCHIRGLQPGGRHSLGQRHIFGQHPRHVQSAGRTIRAEASRPPIQPPLGLDLARPWTEHPL